MSVSPPGRTSLLQPGRSSVPQCRVHHFIVIVLLFVATVASDVPQDLCRQNPATLIDQIHTIGSIDDELWAITKDNWDVYKLTPCDPANYSLVHCMKVDSPVGVDTKWPKLAESFKSSDNAKAFNFAVDNSFVIDSSKFGHTLLVISFSQSERKYFGFDFGTSRYVDTTGRDTESINNGLWISSDVKDKAYRLLDADKQVDLVDIFPAGKSLVIEITPASTSKYICTDTNEKLEVQFKNQSKCDPKMDGSVKKAVLYRKQFYFFTSNTVYIFSDQAETESTKMLSVSLKDFFHCNEPTTTAPPLSSRNATNPRVTTNSTFISTTAKSSSTTIIIIILGVVVIVLVTILVLITSYYFWNITRVPKDYKSDGNSKLASSSPKNSKVITKAPTVSKGSFKQSQNKVKTVAQKASPGKQMKGSSSN